MTDNNTGLDNTWVTLTDGEGWQHFLQAEDIAPHSNESKGGRYILAGTDCPCNPDVDYINKTITHSSFAHMQILADAMKKLF